MATWDDVEGLCAALPDTRLGEAHEGSPAWYAGRHRRDVFPVVHTFEHRVSLWGVLDRLDRRELAELVLDSYGIGGGSRRAARVDRAAYFTLGG